MRYNFDTLILGSSVDAALVAATEQARWLRANPGRRAIDQPDMLALVLKDEHVTIDPPRRHTADQMVRWIRGESEPPKDVTKIVDKARKLAEDPHGPAVVIPLTYNEATRECTRRGLKTRPVRPTMARVVGVVQVPGKVLATNGHGRAAA